MGWTQCIDCRVSPSSPLAVALRGFRAKTCKRRWITEYVCGYVDGRCGERMAEAILDFVKNFARGRE